MESSQYNIKKCLDILFKEIVPGPAKAISETTKTPPHNGAVTVEDKGKVKSPKKKDVIISPPAEAPGTA